MTGVKVPIPPYWNRLPFTLICSIIATLAAAYATALTQGLGRQDFDLEVWWFFWWTLPMCFSLSIIVICLIDSKIFSSSLRSGYTIAALFGVCHGVTWVLIMNSTFEASFVHHYFSVIMPWITGNVAGLLIATAAARKTLTIKPRASEWLAFISSLGLLCLVPFMILASVVILFFGFGDGVVQHTVVSPDKRITALVIRDDCGATCNCEMRVDLQTEDRYMMEVYRSTTACDAEVRWRTPTLLDIHDDDGEQQQLDMRVLHIE